MVHICLHVCVPCLFGFCTGAKYGTHMSTCMCTLSIWVLYRGKVWYTWCTMRLHRCKLSQSLEGLGEFPTPVTGLHQLQALLLHKPEANTI